MIETVIGIRAGRDERKGRKGKEMKDFKKELEEIIEMVEKAKNKLGDLSLEMDKADLDTGIFDEALDEIDDVVDLLNEGIEDLD